MFKTKINDDLRLKILEERDTQDLFQIIGNSREYLDEWLPFIKFTKEKNDTQEFIKSGLKQFLENDGFHCGIWYNNKLIGVIVLYYINWLNEKTSTKNIKSQKIPKKLGFKQEGILRQDEKLNSKYSDSYVFSLLKYEYDN